MPRTVPSALQTRLNQDATSKTTLLLIRPVTQGYDPIGITLLDTDVVYDDGDGPITYLAKIGMIPASLVSSLDMDVDNTEIQSLVPEFDLPISETDISAGVYDYAECTIMMVDYLDLSAGHVVIGFGNTGQMKVQDGLSFWTEFTALSKLLKQTVVEKDSLACRAIFGSQPIGTGGGAVEQRFPCGKDVSTLWSTTKTVTAVGQETTISFAASALGAADSVYAPGVLVWLTGANANRTCEVESQGSDGVINLTFDTMFPITVGDTFKIRPDCTKTVENANGCRAHFGSDWVLHYRGEPYIPVQDADSINMPGAGIGGGTSSR
jgi:uncharacterized phage protein (TIGR02218 family)